jgi:hypothetical protein
MSQVGERKVVLFPQTAVSAGTVADTKPTPVAGYTSAIFILNVPTINTGTTLDVYIQQELPIAGSTDTWGQVPTGTSQWNDIAHFTQVTTSTGVWTAFVVGGGNSAAAQKDAALAAATVNLGPIGTNLRVKYVAVGTSYTFSVTAVLIP